MRPRSPWELAATAARPASRASVGRSTICVRSVSGRCSTGGSNCCATGSGRLMALTACLFVPVWLLQLTLTVFAPPDLGRGPALGPVLVPVVERIELSAGSGRLGAAARGALAAGAVRGAPGSRAGPWRGDHPGRAGVAGAAQVLGRGVDRAAHRRGAPGDRVPGRCRLGARRRAWCSSPRWPRARSDWDRGGRSSAAGSWPGRRSVGRLAISFGGLCISLVVRMSLSFGPAALALSLDPGSPLVGLLGAASTAVLLVTEPLTACIAARAYLDLRCRREGWDLAMRQQRLDVAGREVRRRDPPGSEQRSRSS